MEWTSNNLEFVLNSEQHVTSWTDPNMLMKLQMELEISWNKSKASPFTRYDYKVIEVLLKAALQNWLVHVHGERRPFKKNHAGVCLHPAAARSWVADFLLPLLWRVNLKFDGGWSCTASVLVIRVKIKLRVEYSGAINKWTLLGSAALQYVIQIVTLAFSLCARRYSKHLTPVIFLIVILIFFIDDTYDFIECPHNPVIQVTPSPF